MAFHPPQGPKQGVLPREHGEWIWRSEALGASTFGRVACSLDVMLQHRLPARLCIGLPVPYPLHMDPLSDSEEDQ